MTNLSLYTVRAMIILDGDGNRLIAKYYTRGQAEQSYRSVKEQKKFESELFAKTRKTNAQVVLYDGQTENELLLLSALQGFYDGVCQLVKYDLSKRKVLDNLDMVVLALDEAIDDGIVLETDGNVIASNVSKRGVDTIDMSLSNLNEQTLIDAYKQAKERFNLAMLR
ncbi:coatomer subunit zeta-1-like protein [Kickxella alabastrina]|uniref:coatomer subunit zeta-1-like protein n=1 Tax=Kickxella alabastrina TaxID=61397 RepID=UPI0022204104|nr:coatomer subunit zeta-1-like protein [Kickxella alabastrina]KAI7829988.1 coatomer subunit zeta-1-like protein [Kickxella alabastrina]